MINKGEMVDQMGGVPKDAQKLKDFFSKAKRLGGSGEVEEEGQTTESGGVIETRKLASGVIVEIMNKGDGV